MSISAFLKTSNTWLKQSTTKYQNDIDIWATTWQNQQSDCAPSEDSYQPGHPPSLIKVFAVHMKKAWVLNYLLSAQRRLWSDWADAQADLSLRWAHSHFVGFVMSWFICYNAWQSLHHISISFWYSDVLYTSQVLEVVRNSKNSIFLLI